MGGGFEPENGITSYLHIPAVALDAESDRAVALQLFLESVDWRALAGGEFMRRAAPTSDPVVRAPACPSPLHVEARGPVRPLRLQGCR